MNWKHALCLLILIAFAASHAAADDITTLDGQKYQNVKYVSLKPSGLYFVTGAGETMKGVTVPYNNLPDDLKDKYYCTPFELGMNYARLNQPILMSTNMAFSLATLDAAKAKAKAEKKLIGFILVWDSFFVTGHPLGHGSDSGFAHFYDTFHDGMVLVFVHHETELTSVGIPGAVKAGFFGPEEGGFAPNMAVVTADCSQFVCEIPFGGNDSNGAIREGIFRNKIAVIKKFLSDHPQP